MSFWKRLRVLTTNSCNYHCSFCHNEGQKKEPSQLPVFLNYEDFKVIIDSLHKSGLMEVQFSGGEPFLNPATIDMIRYVDDTTEYDIGCATNLSLVDQSMIESLSSTRIKLNIQFPTVDAVEFSNITRTGDLYRVRSKLDMCKDNGLPFGLNHVLTANNIGKLPDVVKWAIQYDAPLKILLDIYSSTHMSIVKLVHECLDNLSFSKFDLKNGSIKWKVHTALQSHVTITLVNSPCFTKDKASCVNYGEIRLHPDLKLQTCIQDTDYHEFGFPVKSEMSSNIQSKLQDLWISFTSD